MSQDYQENLPNRLAEAISIVLPLIIKRGREKIIFSKDEKKDFSDTEQEQKQ